MGEIELGHQTSQAEQGTPPPLGWWPLDDWLELTEMMYQAPS